MITIGKTKPGENGEFVMVHEAVSGVDYYCLICDCAIRKKKSSADNLFFACRPGQKHLSTQCTRLSSSLRIHDLRVTSSKDFHEHIFTEPLAVESDGSRKAGPRRPSVDQEKISAYRSLADIWNSGLVQSGRDLPILNGHLSDILINSRLSPMIMRDNASLGPRVLLVRPDFYMWKSQVIRFLMFGVSEASSGSIHYRYKVFDVYFKEKNTFRYYVNRLFVTAFSEKNTIKTVSPLYNTVLVHGNWNATAQENCHNICGRKNCNGKWRCCGYQHSMFRSSRQIFLPRDQKIDSV